MPTQLQRTTAPKPPPSFLGDTLSLVGSSVANIFTMESTAEKERRTRREQAEARVDAVQAAARLERAESQRIVIIQAEEERQRRIEEEVAVEQAERIANRKQVNNAMEEERERRTFEISESLLLARQIAQVIRKEVSIGRIELLPSDVCEAGHAKTTIEPPGTQQASLVTAPAVNMGAARELQQRSATTLHTSEVQAQESKQDALVAAREEMALAHTHALLVAKTQAEETKAAALAAARDQAATALAHAVQSAASEAAAAAFQSAQASATRERAAALAAAHEEAKADQAAAVHSATTGLQHALVAAQARSEQAEVRVEATRAELLTMRRLAAAALLAFALLLTFLVGLKLSPAFRGLILGDAPVPPPPPLLNTPVPALPPVCKALSRLSMKLQRMRRILRKVRLLKP